MSTSLSTESSSTELLARIEFLKDQLDEAHFRIQGLDEDIAEKRREIGRLERQIAKTEKEGVKTGLVEDIFQLWVNLNQKRPTTKLTPDRRKAITAALKLHGEANVRKVIAQNAKTPYLVYTAWRATGNRDSLRDVTDILGKGKHFDALLELANATPVLDLSDNQIHEWHDRLLSNEAVCQRVHELRGWESEVLESFQVGFDGQRLVFPVRDPEGNLLGAIRYLPGDRKQDQPKSLATGTRSLFPSPETLDSAVIWLVEGEPDALTAHQNWMPGVSVPGASVKPGDWMKRLKNKRVVVCFDCDQAGRAAANRIARPLTQYAAEVKVVDLDPSRADGYDISDWFGQGRTRKTLEELARVAKPVSSVSTPQLLPQQTTRHGDDHDALFDDFVRALEQRDCDPKEGRGGQWTARCPVHDDRVPTLYFRRGEITPVVTDCKAGCEWPAIKETLAWPARKEF